jgi:cytochrome c biogenesis protein CcdA
MLGAVLLVLLITLIIGSIPGAWPHTRDWSRWPMGLLMLVLAIVLIAMLRHGL